MKHEGQEIRFTISLGVAEADETLESYKTWLEYADKALYASKEGGRNRYPVHQYSNS